MSQDYSLHKEDNRRSIFDKIPNVPICNEKNKNIWPLKSDDLGQQIEKIWNLEQNFSFSQTWALSNYNKAVCVVNAYTGYYFSKIFRKAVNYNTAGIGAVNILFPSIIGSFVFSTYLHTKQFTIPMALDPDQNPSSLIASSLGVHMFSSCAYQILFTSVASVFVASKAGTFPLPDNFLVTKAGRDYVFNTVIRKAVNSNRKGFAVAFGVNSALCLLLSSIEALQIKNLSHLSKQSKAL